MPLTADSILTNRTKKDILYFGGAAVPPDAGVAASSSLATPILQTHVDSVRIGVRFCFVVEIAGRISEGVQKPRTL